MRARYGASPLHLLAHLIVFPLAAWALLGVFDHRANALHTAEWLLGAIVLHDFILLPAYSTLDRLAARATRGAVNYVRVPVGIWLLLGIVFSPSILGKGDAAFHRTSGLHYHGYLARWLLTGAALCAGSAATYLLQARARRNSP
jgi:hypothetical protein